MCACVDPRPSLRPACELAAVAALFAVLSLLWNPFGSPAAANADSASAAPASVSPADAAHAVSVAATRQDPRFQNALWIDARSPAAFDAGHISGALRLTEPEWEQLLPAVIDRWSPGGVIVVYCDSSSCRTSAHIAARLRRELAADSVYSLTGGWDALRAAP